MKLVKMVCVAMLLGAVSIEAGELHMAAQYSYGDNGFDKVKLLVSKGADVNEKDYNGETPLMAGVQSADKPVEITKYLIEKGADVNAKDNKGRTALMMASSKSFPPTVKVLIESGGCGFFSFFSKSKCVDINAKDNDGRTALMYVNSKFYDEVRSLMYTDELHSKRELDIVKYLVSKGADINIKDNYGKTILDYTKNGEVSEFLISKGAKR